MSVTFSSTSRIEVFLMAMFALILSQHPYPCWAVEIELDDYNLCLISKTEFDAFINCMFVESETTEEFKKETGDIINKFPGLSIWEIANIICKANGDRGDEVLDEFLGSFPDSLSKEIASLVSICIPKAKSIN